MTVTALPFATSTSANEPDAPPELIVTSSRTTIVASVAPVKSRVAAVVLSYCLGVTATPETVRFFAVIEKLAGTKVIV